MIFKHCDNGISCVIAKQFYPLTQSEKKITVNLMQNFKAFYLLLDKDLYGSFFFGCFALILSFDQSSIVDTKRNHDKS